jgi:hypothetical protein
MWKQKFDLIKRFEFIYFKLGKEMKSFNQNLQRLILMLSLRNNPNLSNLYSISISFYFISIQFKCEFKSMIT